MSKKVIDNLQEDSYTLPVLARLRMKDIYKALQEKQQELEGLQREINALRMAIKILGAEDIPKSKGKQNQPQMMVAILEANGKPMHVKHIAEQMRKQFKKSIKTNNVSVLLYRYANRGKHFHKVVGKPNTYGLIRWESIRLPEAPKPIHVIGISE